MESSLCNLQLDVMLEIGEYMWPVSLVNVFFEITRGSAFM